MCKRYRPKRPLRPGWFCFSLLAAAFFSAAILRAEPQAETSVKLRANLLEARKLLDVWSKSLDARESDLAEREAFLSAIEQRLNEREATLEQSGTSLAEREKLLSEREADYQASERLIEDLHSSLTKVSASLVATERELWSWRIGAGIAAVLALIGWVLTAF